MINAATKKKEQSVRREDTFFHVLFSCQNLECIWKHFCAECIEKRTKSCATLGAIEKVRHSG